MKELFMYVAFFIVFLLIVGGLVYAARSFSQAVTPINTYVPKQGVTCAYMVTSDGAAISCWKD